MSTHRIRLSAAFGALYLIWGFTFLGNRFALATVRPFAVAGTRCFLAGGSALLVIEVQSGEFSRLDGATVSFCSLTAVEYLEVFGPVVAFGA